MEECILCKKQSKMYKASYMTSFDCQNCGKYGYNNMQIDLAINRLGKAVVINNMTSNLLRIKRRHDNLGVMFWYDENKNESQYDKRDVNLNLYELIPTIPLDESSRLKQSFVNLCNLFTNKGDLIHEELLYPSLILSKSENNVEVKNDWQYQFNYFIRKGYMDEGPPRSSQYRQYRVSPEGWEYYNQCDKAASRIGFIAIKFLGTESIVDAIKKGSEIAGYTARTISDKEYNGQIVPEILYEIRNSAFLVMDVTVQNYGAYYEAGYAKGYGIPVIFTCDEQVFNEDKHETHFDIRQENMLLYSSYDILVKKLANRIKATIN